MHQSAGERRGLVMVSDPELLDTLLRLAAAAGASSTARSTRRRPVRTGRERLSCSWTRPRPGGARRPGCPGEAWCRLSAANQPRPVWQHAVAVGAEHVVSLPEAESWLVTALTEAAEGPRRGGAVLAVVGGRGGAGASVLAAAVAVTAVRDGERALLVDCDPLGGGLDLVLGAEELGGLRWPEIAVGGGRVPATALHAALPAPAVARRGGGELGVLSCDRSADGPSPAAVRSVIDAGRRAGEIVVCDLPRYPTEAAVAALCAADLTVLVVPADVRSCAAAARVAAVLAEHGGAVRLVVRGPAPGGVARRRGRPRARAAAARRDASGARAGPGAGARRRTGTAARAARRRRPHGAGRARALAGPASGVAT